MDDFNEERELSLQEARETLLSVEHYIVLAEDDNQVKFVGYASEADQLSLVLDFLRANPRIANAVEQFLALEKGKTKWSA